MAYNIFKRGARLRTGNKLVYVCTIYAKDAVEAMRQFCGQPQNCQFVAMEGSWNGNSRYKIAGNRNINFA